MKKLLILSLILIINIMHAENPFNYDLHLYSIPGKTNRPMICFHGYGANYQIANTLKNIDCIDDTLVSFNFPEYNIFSRNLDPANLSFGSIQELLPAFYVVKKYVIDKGADQIDLYGFSAGGGAIVNLIAILNTNRYPTELSKFGINEPERKKILEAIQKGIVILEVPLKSIDELIEMGGSNRELNRTAHRYRMNNLRPIDTVMDWKGLSLNVLVYFSKKDEMIFNRDDQLFIDRLKKANAKGKTWDIIGNEIGHLQFHRSLWEKYCQIK